MASLLLPMEPSLKSASIVNPLSFDHVLSRLKPLLDGKTREREMSIEGVPSYVIDKLRASDLPGWENIRIDFSQGKLIVHYPSIGTEIMPSLFLRIGAKDSNGAPLFSTDTGILLGGSADVDLEDGIKSPNFSLYENNPMKLPLTQAWPTIVWEVAYSENAKKLAYDLGRFVACSLGRIRLGVGINIDRKKDATTGGGSVKKVTCTFWEVDYVEDFKTLEESGSNSINKLTRCDEYAEMAHERVAPPAAKFFCVSEFEGEYLKFVVSQHEIHIISPEEHNEPKAINILNRHLYRTSKPEDEDKIAFSIPYLTLLDVINRHQKLQDYQNTAREIKKRESEEKNQYDRENEEDTATEINRLIMRGPRVD